MAPILHSNAFVTDFKKKAKLSNSYFVNQCTLINNNSTLPVNVQYLTDKHLSFDFSARFLKMIGPFGFWKKFL